MNKSTFINPLNFQLEKAKGTVYINDARKGMREIADRSVHLVVTSPPYPMIQIWDRQFRELDPNIEQIWRALERTPDDIAKEAKVSEIYALMHKNLNSVWFAIYNKLIDGGIACINIGDATRRINGTFRLFPNHAKIVESCERIGFMPLPFIIWRKPINKPSYNGKGAFLGSGMLPPNAYVGLDSEFILLFRKGKPRKFERFDKMRYASKYTKQERNEWFTQIWEGINGVRQHNPNGRRVGAFPDAVPTRLIKMFSVIGDTVLDPYMGTGTTLRVALALGRNAVGYELDYGFAQIIKRNLPSQPRSHQG